MRTLTSRASACPNWTWREYKEKRRMIDTQRSGRLCRKVASFHYRVERAAEIILSGLQSVKATSKTWRREKEHSIRVRVPIQQSSRDLTCKSDDVQCYAIHIAARTSVVMPSDGLSWICDCQSSHICWLLMSQERANPKRMRRKVWSGALYHWRRESTNKSVVGPNAGSCGKCWFLTYGLGFREKCSNC